MTYSIIPSLLAADLTRLGEEIERLVEAGVHSVHLDVMDNHYVPNVTFGPDFCRQIHQRFPNLKIDVHLMTTPVDSLIEAFAQSGAARISIHPDATMHLDRSLQYIKSFNLSAGLAINPGLPIDCLTWSAYHLDFILIMTVNPGFGGQVFLPQSLEKIEAIRRAYPNKTLVVDGGVTVDNIAAIAKAGATQFVSGSSLFSSANYAKTIKAMYAQIATVS